MRVWPAEDIWQEIAPLLPGFTVEVLPEIDSTNTELMRRARAGRTEPTLLVAEHQSAGRGRQGRHWASEPGDALTFSLGMPYAPRDWSGLSLLVGLVAAQALHPDIRLKWPNDLWWQDRKLAGILVEAASTGGHSHVVVGMGINIRPVQATQALRTPPAALQELLPTMTAPQALSLLAGALVRALLDFETQGFAPWQHAFDARDALKGRTVWTSDGQQGHALGIDPLGALRLETDRGPVQVNSAEVSVRPHPFV